MSNEGLNVIYKRTDDMLIASIRFQLEKRKELEPKFEKLGQHCKDTICGPAFIIYHWGTGVSATFDIEAGFPVTQAIETDEIKSRVLKSEEVLSLVHKGPYKTLGDTEGKLYGYAIEHGLNPALCQREIYLKVDDEHPEENETELHVVLHSWNDLLAENLERVLGAEARKEVMAGSDQVSAETSMDKRAQWIKSAMDRLDQLAGKEQRYDIVSSCAHIFPRERIDKLRAIYQQSQDVDKVLQTMCEDTFWFEEPIRKGNVIHATKNPFDSEAFKKAKTEAEKRRAYCHCNMIKNHLDEMNVTFCHCGAGWYRQLWEGILEKPVRIELMKSLVKGDDVCQVAIHLPQAEQVPA